MKLKLCLVLLLVALLVTDLADAKRRRRGRRRNRLRNKKTTTTTTTTTTTEAPAVEETAEDEFDLLIDDGAAMFGEDEEEEEVSEDGEEEEEAEEEQEDPMTRIIYRNNLSNDPCLKKKCGKGRECTLTEKAEPVCTCIAECTHEDDVRRQVCTNHNDTWNSDCAVYKQRCECDDELDGCRDPKNKHLHIEYYGQCRDLGVCTSEEMSDFPRRMREWLFNVMKDLAERQQLGPLYSEMEQEAETDEQKRWVNAAIWRWCELDQHPSDSSVSRHELFPIRATLLSMEHCISPFLDGCDTNGDRDISLSEWAKCLKVTDGEIKERCERIKNSE